MPPGETVVQSPTESAPTLGDIDREDTSLDDVYLDRTLVLVGSGAAKRDLSDPVDVHAAAVPPGEEFSENGVDVEGPGWRAEDLYTSPYFRAKRAFAETVSAWGRTRSKRGASPWAILSAEHDILQPTRTLRPYETSIDDLGGDETNPDHRVRNPYGRRRPDGREIVTERDQWAASVAFSLACWLADFRDRGMKPWENSANTLLVLAGQSYIEPLRNRGVFEYGISRMTGDPNQGYTLPVETRFLFEEIDAGGISEQTGWLSSAVDRLDHGPSESGDQHDLSAWTGDRRVCEDCEQSAPAVELDAYGSRLYCEACAPRRCARCEDWTHATGIGSYPLCENCQTHGGGQKREPYNPNPDPTEQTNLRLSQTND